MNKYVYLGRFAPFHKGHQGLLKKMIQIANGIQNCLLIIGSANRYTHDTPFSFQQRKKIISDLFPDLQILPLDDIFAERIDRDDIENSIVLWLKNLKEIEKKMNTSFIFCGGSKKDLRYFNGYKDTNGQDLSFQSMLLVDRSIDGTSSSKIRKILNNKKINSQEKKILLTKMVPTVNPLLPYL